MSNRLIRINELVQREISAYLRKHYQAEAANLSVMGVDIATDLKTGKVFISIIGTAEEAEARMKWLNTKAPEIRKEVGRQVVLKWTPDLKYILDVTPERASRVLNIIEEFDRKDKEQLGK